jgi:conjugative transfer signal peptidase TraF
MRTFTQEEKIGDPMICLAVKKMRSHFSTHNPKPGKRILVVLLSIMILIIGLLPIEYPFGVRINSSDSLPYHLFFSRKGQPKLERGRIIAFINPRLSTDLLAKEIIGLPGDKIFIKEQSVFINDKPIGKVLEKSSSGKKFNPIQEGVIPEGYVFVCGAHEQSFDSRYQEFGLINIENIKESLWPLF